MPTVPFYKTSRHFWTYMTTRDFKDHVYRLLISQHFGTYMTTQELEDRAVELVLTFLSAPETALPATGLDTAICLFIADCTSDLYLAASSPDPRATLRVALDVWTWKPIPGIKTLKGDLVGGLFIGLLADLSTLVDLYDNSRPKK